MEECLSLLSANNDERRLVGLLLATQELSGGDKDGVLKIYNAVGIQFVNRLLKTGLDQEDQQSSLGLALNVLSAFSRIPELASKDEFLGTVPSILRALSNKDGDVVADGCECLLGIAAASENGFTTVVGTATFHTVGNLLEEADPDFQGIPGAAKLLHFLASGIISTNKVSFYGKHLAIVVPSVSKQFLRQQSMLKFDMLELLRILLVALPTRSEVKVGPWTADVRTGLAYILQSRVDPAYRNAALELVEAMVEIVGEAWLVGETTFPDSQAASTERFLVLLVELLRVEIEVLLGEISRSQTMNPAGPQSSLESLRKQQALATYYALVERVINLLVSEDPSVKIDNATTVLSAVDHIVGVVLEFLEHAKEEGINRGDELLSSVRLLGRYLADSPMSHNERVLKILGFALSITTEGQSPYYATRFMIPALCQITMAENGCEAVLSSRSHHQVISFVVTAIENGEDAPVNEVCDIILNILLKKDNLLNEVNYVDFVPALPPLATWAVKANQSMEIALATSLSVTLLNMTSESALMSSLKAQELELVFNLIDRCLMRYQEGDASQEEDLLDMVIAGCLRCLGRYPSLESALRRSAWVHSARLSLQGGSNFRMLVGKLVA